ncbi:MAG: GNAT family protein [Leadbetterella sp.]|nr:GNAT family protein [Leadbetterella sp.]
MHQRILSSSAGLASAMSKFKIFQENPAQFKMEILNFWQEYLTGTAPERLDWMENNPAGSAIWLFAIEEKTGKLVGTISLFPKDLFLDGKRIKAAILGDFMLDKKFRVFGPALSLLKAAIVFKEEGKFDFLYTIPNLKSKKIVEKAGFKSVGKLYYLISPLQCDFVIKKYVGSVMAKIMGKSLLLVMKLFSRSTFANSSGVFEENNWHDEAFVQFCQQIKKNRVDMMTGDYSLSYLDWRYRQNPESYFHVITYRKHTGSDIQGFFVFSLTKSRLELHDIVAGSARIILTMLKKINYIAKNEKCRGIYILIYQNNPLLSVLRRCCFFDTKDQIEIYTYPEEIKEVGHWCCTSADKNI